MTSEILRSAQRALVIQDVYVREASATTHPDFDPIAAAAGPAQGMVVQFRIDAEGDVKIFTPAPNGEQTLPIGYVIDTALRILKPGIDIGTQDPQENDILAEIAAKFVARYAVLGEQPSQEMLRAFADNAIHHVWPYWREFLQATAARLRLPPIVLPMRIAGTRAAVPNESAPTSSLAPP